jgi:hypothetical protein
MNGFGRLKRLHTAKVHSNGWRDFHRTLNLGALHRHSLDMDSASQYTGCDPDPQDEALNKRTPSPGDTY